MTWPEAVASLGAMARIRRNCLGIRMVAGDAQSVIERRSEHGNEVDAGTS
jgi:hypothetical protein